jgi:hypothetical protein
VSDASVPVKQVDLCRKIELPKIADRRGNLTFVEGLNHIPFSIRRAYWIYDVPGGEHRGGHGYRHLHEFIVALSGSLDVELNDGEAQRVIPLNRSYNGLYVANRVWRQLKNFSTNAVALILASDYYDVDDYLATVEDLREYVASLRS